MMTAAWGQVTQTSPTLQVRFAGDTVDVDVNEVSVPALSLTTGDLVGLIKFGSRWYVTAVL